VVAGQVAVRLAAVADQAVELVGLKPRLCQ
jgi:hypothetical protein